MADYHHIHETMPPSIYADGTYGVRHPTWHAEHAAWKAAQIARMLARHAMAPRTICEVGCGAGDVLRELQTSHLTDAECWGFDISPQAIEICRLKATPTRHYALGDPSAVLGRPFDLVLALDVVEHVEDCFEFLRRIRPLGTRTLLHVPLDLSILGLVTRLPERVRASVGHLHYFTKDTCLAMVAECGFTIVDHAYTASAVEAPNSAWRTRLARTPRSLAFGLHQDGAARLLGGYSLLVLAEPGGAGRQP